VGLNYNDVSQFGLSYNWLGSKLEKSVFDTKYQKIDTAKLQLSYIAPFFEYTFYRTKRFWASIPVQIGVGISHFVYNDEGGKRRIVHQQPVILYEPSMIFEYRLFRYMGIGSGIGYRIMLLNNKAIGESFNSPIYLFWGRIYFGKIYDDLFKPNKKNEN